jgi:hypothetical protein
MFRKSLCNPKGRVADEIVKGTSVIKKVPQDVPATVGKAPVAVRPCPVADCTLRPEPQAGSWIEPVNVSTSNNLSLHHRGSV